MTLAMLDYKVMYIFCYLKNYDIDILYLKFEAELLITFLMNNSQ